MPVTVTAVLQGLRQVGDLLGAYASLPSRYRTAVNDLLLLETALVQYGAGPRSSSRLRPCLEAIQRAVRKLTKKVKNGMTAKPLRRAWLAATGDGKATLARLNELRHSVELLGALVVHARDDARFDAARTIASTVPKKEAAAAIDFWDLHFGSERSSVLLADLLLALEVRGAKLKMQQRTLLEGLLDPCCSGSVSAAAYALFVSRFGPVSTCVQTTTTSLLNTATGEAFPWFKYDAYEEQLRGCGLPYAVAYGDEPGSFMVVAGAATETARRRGGAFEVTPTLRGLLITQADGKTVAGDVVRYATLGLLARDVAAVAQLESLSLASPRPESVNSVDSVSSDSSTGTEPLRALRRDRNAPPVYVMMASLMAAHALSRALPVPTRIVPPQDVFTVDWSAARGVVAHASLAGDWDEACTNIVYVGEADGRRCVAEPAAPADIQRLLFSAH